MAPANVSWKGSKVRTLTKTAARAATCAGGLFELSRRLVSAVVAASHYQSCPLSHKVPKGPIKSVRRSWFRLTALPMHEPRSLLACRALHAFAVHQPGALLARTSSGHRRSCGRRRTGGTQRRGRRGYGGGGHD